MLQFQFFFSEIPTNYLMLCKHTLFDLFKYSLPKKLYFLKLPEWVFTACLNLPINYDFHKIWNSTRFLKKYWYFLRVSYTLANIGTVQATKYPNYTDCIHKFKIRECSDTSQKDKTAKLQFLLKLRNTAKVHKLNSFVWYIRNPAEGAMQWWSFGYRRATKFPMRPPAIW